MELRFRFENSKGEYIKERMPLVYTPSITEAVTITVDSEDIDDSFIDKNIIPYLSAVATADPVSTNHIIVYNSSEEELFKIDYSRKGLTVSTNPKTSSSPDAVEALNHIRWMSEYLIEELPGIYMRSVFSSLKASASKLADATDAMATGSGSFGAAEDEDAKLEKFIEAISKETPAEVVKPKETLKDYVCNDTLKTELLEIVDFFDNFTVYKTANVEVPKGILFKGPWGTGKTFAARCIAGTVGCHFMTCTASALQGKYIGSGAENIRNVFKAARTLATKSKKGVILFIDELDSFGDRQNRSGGASDEEDRTLNQLLAEMSGFTDTENIMVLAATNFPERLDSALLRSGRFGRQITISYPEDEERLNLVTHYFNKLNIKLDTDVEYIDIAELTAGLTPADIKEISNESGILAIRRKLSKINLDCVNESINKVLTKDIRKPDKSTEEVELVTAHESGHVVAEVIYNGTYPIKVTNYAYGDAGGFTQSAEVMSGILPKEKFINKVKMLLAGRAAEQVICGYVTNGASEDLKRAKDYLYSYYKYYNFETYEVDKLNQIVLDKLNELQEEVIDDFKDDTHRKLLHDLVSNLTTSRVLYKSDIIPLAKKYGY